MKVSIFCKLVVAFDKTLVMNGSTHPTMVSSYRDAHACGGGLYVHGSYRRGGGGGGLAGCAQKCTLDMMLHDA